MRPTSFGVVLAAALTASGCYTLKSLTWAEIEGLRPSRVWVTHDDQRVVLLSGPRVFGDTVVGYVAGEFTELPTAALQTVKIRRINRAKTIGVIAAGTAAAAAIAVWMSGVGDPSPRDEVDCNDVPDHPLCQF